MSGTSADGIDAVVVNFDKNLVIEDTEFEAYPKPIKSSIKQLQLNNQLPYHELAVLDIELGSIASRLVNKIVKRHPDKTILAIGSHGQSIQHQPNNNSAYTLQIGNAAILTEKTGITVVNNFRSRDIAMGGQGAPFAPLFHQAFFADENQSRVIVNVGGIANLSYLDSNDDVIGFDTGPGNTLIDAICTKHFNRDYDDQGELSADGNIDTELLQLMLADPYFDLHPPKSTGQEYFNQDWLSTYLSKTKQLVKPLDLLTTITKLTADSIAQSIEQFCPDTEAIFICGGGAHNQTLLNFLAQASGSKILTTESLNIHPDWVEACGFAWLAKQAIEGIPVDLTTITGASKPCILGSIWPNNIS